jgi:hypothetical protein
MFRNSLNDNVIERIVTSYLEVALPGATEFAESTLFVSDSCTVKFHPIEGNAWDDEEVDDDVEEEAEEEEEE